MFRRQSSYGKTRGKVIDNKSSDDLDLESLYYNFHQCTNGSRQEFEELTLGEVQNIIITYVNVNGKNNKKAKEKNESKTIKGEKMTFMNLNIE